MTPRKKRETFVAVDGTALAYRSHFAFINRPIYTSQGLNSSAIYGFTQTLLEIMNSQKPTHMVVAFDTEEPTQRHEEFEEYKRIGEAKGFQMVASSPLTRSSYHADRDFEKLRAARQAALAQI